jgi:hypothetical protein
MEEPYGPEWPSEQKLKCREMVAPQVPGIFVKQYSNDFITENSKKERHGGGTCMQHLLKL